MRNLSLLITADGKRIISGDKNGTLKLWDIQSGDEIHTFNGYSCRGVSFATMTNGQYVILGDDFGTIKLWDVESGREMVKFVVFEDNEWIASTPDGYYNTSPEGSSLIHWSSIDRKETYSFEQFESLFRRPDIIKARLSGDLNAGKPAPELTPPPSVEIAGDIHFKGGHHLSEFIMNLTSNNSSLLLNNILKVCGKIL